MARSNAMFDHTKMVLLENFVVAKFCKIFEACQRCPIGINNAK